MASYADNSGDNTTDGRCRHPPDPAGLRRPALTSTAGTALATARPDCVGSVIVTNSYVTTTEAPTTTAAPATTAAPTTTAAPAVAPAPAEPVVEAPTFTG